MTWRLGHWPRFDPGVSVLHITVIDHWLSNRAPVGAERTLKHLITCASVLVWCEGLPTHLRCWGGRFWCADQFHMRVTVLHVLCPTADIDISLVTVGQRAVEFTLFGPPVAGLLGDLCSSFNSFSYSSLSSFSYSSLISFSYSSFISFSFNFTFTTSGGLDRGWMIVSEMPVHLFFAMKHSTTVFISTLNCLRPLADSICFKIPTFCELKFGCRIM